MMDILFSIAAGVALLSAILAVTGYNIAHSLLYMVITMVSLSFIYFLLGAPFPAALQIIVYAGAIVVLFVFVTMMLHQGEITLRRERELFSRTRALLPLLLSGILFGEMAFLVSPLADSLAGGTASADMAVHEIGIRELGLKLYGPYLMLVELASLLLVSALAGAFHIGRRKQDEQS